MAATVLGRSVGTRYTTQITTAHHQVIADEPAPDGDDLGPTPYELLLSAVGACTSMTLLMYARRKGWPLQDVHVELTHDRDYVRDCENCEGGEVKLERVQRHIRLIGPLSEEQRARLGEIAARCPVHRTLSAATLIEDTLEPA